MNEVEDVQVGEYIRTKNGYIGKIVDIVCGQDAYFDNREMFLGFNMGYVMYSINGIDIYSRTFQENVKKHSFNIIDLIEVGDYVNGNKVVYTVSEKGEEPYLDVVVSSKMIKEPLDDYIVNNRIKSIVTKEQFKAMEYEVK